MLITDSKTLQRLIIIRTEIVKAKRLESFIENKKDVKYTYLPDTEEYYVVWKQYSNLSYDDIVNNMVREKYSQSQENCMFRKGIVNPLNEEFVEFNTYVEECKRLAKLFIEERDNAK